MRDAFAKRGLRDGDGRKLRSGGCRWIIKQPRIIRRIVGFVPDFFLSNRVNRRLGVGRIARRGGGKSGFGR